MDVRVYELPPIGTNCYLLLEPTRQAVAVVDAPLNSFATVEKILVETGYRLEALLMTHGHWDHTLDATRFNAFGTPVYGHPAERAFFETPEVMEPFTMPGLKMPPTRIDHWVEDGQELQILGQTVEVRHVPGHSPGSVLYWFRESSFAFSGDAIFQRSIGRTDFPGCSFQTLEASIRQRIYTLPGETRLYPGHGPHTSVGAEIQGNPYVRPSGQVS